jgi:hypothetical protein
MPSARLDGESTACLVVDLRFFEGRRQAEQSGTTIELGSSLNFTVEALNWPLAQYGEARRDQSEPNSNSAFSSISSQV